MYTKIPIAQQFMDFDANGGTRNDGGSAIIDALIISRLKISNTPVDSRLNSRSIGVFDIFNRAMMRASTISESPSFLVPPFALKSMNSWAIGIFVYIHSAKSI